jgi:hypothetical protein
VTARDRADVRILGTLLVIVAPAAGALSGEVVLFAATIPGLAVLALLAPDRPRRRRVK